MSLPPTTKARQDPDDDASGYLETSKNVCTGSEQRDLLHFVVCTVPHKGLIGTKDGHLTGGLCNLQDPVSVSVCACSSTEPLLVINSTSTRYMRKGRPDRLITLAEWS